MRKTWIMVLWFVFTFAVGYVCSRMFTMKIAALIGLWLIVSFVVGWLWGGFCRVGEGKDGQ